MSITINATKNVTFNSRGQIFNQTRGSGEVGNIVINTPSLSFKENSIIFSRTGIDFSNSNFPVSRITADNNFATGDAGDIILNVGTLSLTHNNDEFRNRDGSKVQSQTFGAGRAGNIIINATESISLSSNFINQNNPNQSRSLIFSDFGSTTTSETEGIRQAGDITIDTPSLSLDNSAITASTRGDGNGGNIDINAANTVSLESRSSIDASSSAFSNNTRSAGNGNAGSIDIQAGESISLTSNSTVTTNVNEEARGNGGDITLTASDLDVNNRSRIQASTASPNGNSNAGSIILRLAAKFFMIESVCVKECSKTRETLMAEKLM